MARWIKADGTEQEVHPKDGHEFTNTELHDMVDGFLTALTLTDNSQSGLSMFQDDESMAKGKPINRVATELLHTHRANLVHIEVYGDVVVADIDETGDES